MRAWPVLLFCLAAACASAPPRPVVRVECKRLYVYWPNPYGNHTSFLIRKADFPVPEVFSPAPGPTGERELWGDPNDNPNERTEWIEVGYGNAEHFERGTVSIWSILHDARGDLLVRPFPLGGDPGDWKSTDVISWPVELPPDRYRVLLDYISASFLRGADGAPVLMKRVDAASFYRSGLPYSFRRFCHVWLLEGLKRAGLDTSPWTVDQSQIIDWFQHWYRTPAACRPNP